MDFGMVEADRAPEHADLAVVVYSVLTSLHYEADGCLELLHSRKAVGMLVVEAGVHIHFEGILGFCSHWHTQEGLVVI